MKHTLILALTLTSACTLATDPGPVMSYELDGIWCTQAEQPQVCLTVTQAPNNTAHYVWQQGLCFEHGTLTGGLEFTPDTSSRLCLAPEYGLYSAGCEWTAIGLLCDVDTETNEVRAYTGAQLPTSKHTLNMVKR